MTATAQIDLNNQQSHIDLPPFLLHIVALYNEKGAMNYGEDISQTEHAVQCAELAIQAGESPELVTAALLHDIGHLIAQTDIAYGNYKHDQVGAEYLSQHFGPQVTEPIRLHAQAKRFLCTQEQGYFDRLSPASVNSLKNQGGLMSELEQQAFLDSSYFEDAIKLRRWDDEGKNIELNKRPIHSYLQYMTSALQSHTESTTKLKVQRSNLDNQAQQFQQQGYIVLPNAMNTIEIQNLESEVTQLNSHAKFTLQQLSKSGQNIDDYYKENLEELIVVPELADPTTVCRYEYINGYNKTIRNQLTPKLQTLIKQLTGIDFVLFKDKCNEKNPGGGAFDPHQDVIAYDHFKPKYHITVAIFLDDATLENGCLYFPSNYLDDLTNKNTRKVMTKVGERPVLESEKGGNKHGAIKQTITDQLNWQPIPAKRGDLVIFDSYVPHYSNRNNSKNARRAMFFTFNAAADGDYYDAYYKMKHQEFSNPNFHVATPTKHK